MKAKLLLLALLATAAGVRAQTPPPAGTPPNTAAPGTDWSAPGAAGRAETTAARAERLAQIRAANTNRSPVSRIGRLPAPVVPAASAGNVAPADPAAGAPAPNVPAALPPLGDLGAVSIRPPSTASTIPNPDQIFEPLSINWVAAPLESVVEQYAEFVGRNLLRPAQLPKAEIVLKQTTPLTKLEVVRMIEASLYLNQVSVVNVGEKFVTVVPTAEAFKIPGFINTNDVAELPPLGTIITHVVQLKYTKPQEMVQILTPFASGTSQQPIMPIDSSGMLVLRDNVANVKRMLEMIEKIDQVAQSEIISEVIPIKYAKAEEIASALSSVGGGTGGTVGTRSSSTGVASRNSRTGTGANQGYNPANPMGNPAAATPTPSSNATFGDRVRNLISKAATAGDFNILGETKIIADIRSNSLLVFASRQDMEMIKDIIRKLDVVLAQVLIETVIMDVSLGNKWELGVSVAQNEIKNGKTTGIGGYNNSNPFYNFLGAATNTFPGNFTGTLPDSSFSYFGQIGAGPQFELALKAAASDNRVNVIQKPRILTSHATPASIFIGSTVPYVTGTYYGYGVGSGGSSSYQQLKVGIGLDVTPFINQDGLVVMQIQETIDEVSGFTTIENVGDVPNTTSRTLSAEVAVKDGDSIVLGGFIRNSDAKNKSGVPLLKDIPLLGALFSSRSSNKSRTELMVLMRPTVLRTPELAAAHLEVEKERLPGVRAAERELDKVELQRVDDEKKRHPVVKPAAAAPVAAPVAPVAAPAPAPVAKQPPAKNGFKEPTPFTAEEEEMLLNAPPVTAK